jgi:hypothetical protein
MSDKKEQKRIPEITWSSPREVSPLAAQPVSPPPQILRGKENVNSDLRPKETPKEKK